MAVMRSLTEVNAAADGPFGLAGKPFAEHIRTGYTAEKPVRVMVSIIPGDTVILQYTVPT